MGQFINTIPDNILPDLIEAYCEDFSYESSKLPNETKAAFAKRMIIYLQKRRLKRYYLRKENRESASQVIVDAANITID